ncbi:uncharacterized protein LOC143557494 isoform X2 [Bidens hawaiensis]|uniref:uncharacterized protein LOC143557494 isoform X2 n=1 Tax=Bidens hawaiensis TaxID=980011 RepID=UPI00404A4147
MEGSTDKTIDYLRARLLAERSVSKTAKQRANELAKRVTELEKQLKFVTLQRKKAERAAADVLAILENHGKTDISEPNDSSSNEEEMSSDFMEDKRVETEGFSGSEVESSSVNGKSKNTSSRFLDKKYMDASRRRRNSFTSTSSSPRRVGKSCRQIRHKEHRSGDDASQNNDDTNDHHENGGQTNSEGIQNSADVATETSLEEPNMCNGHVVQNNGTEGEMERALKHQAQFIAQYEEEEKVQKEWEDKFRETNGSIQVCSLVSYSCLCGNFDPFTYEYFQENLYDHGIHSDVTEEIEETKASSLLPPGATDKLTSESQPVDHGEVDPTLCENPKTNPEPLPSHTTKNEPLESQSQPPDSNLSQSQASSSKGKSYEPDVETEKVPNELGSVLEALQQAKLSLKQNFEKFPLSENGLSVTNYRGGEKFPVPFSSAGLFRLPTDYEYEGTTLRVNSLTYDPRLSLTNYPTVDSDRSQFVSSPYRESFSRSSSSLDDRFRMVPTFPYQETMPEIPKIPSSAHTPRLDMGPLARDPRLDMGMSTPVRDPRLGMGSSVDPRFGVGPPARDPRLDTGMGPLARDPRLGMGSSVDPRFGVAPSVDQRFGVSPSVNPRLGVGPSTFEPRLAVGSAALDPRVGVGPSTYEPRLGVGRSTFEPRLDVGPSTFEPRLGVGPSTFDPRLDTGPPFMGDRRLNESKRPPYNDYTRPNSYK